jgi:hypothetical protein
MKNGAWNKNGCWHGLSAKDVLRAAQPCARNLSTVGVKLHPCLLIPGRTSALLKKRTHRIRPFLA